MLLPSELEGMPTLDLAIDLAMQDRLTEGNNLR
jgi:hypothetical protein